MLAVGHERVGTDGASGKHHAPGGVRLPVSSEPGTRALRGHPVSVATVGGTDRRHVDNLAFGMDLHAPLLGEPEVVLRQRVRSTDATAHQAVSAASTARPRRTFAPEVGILDGLARLTEEDAHGRAREGVLDPEVLRHLLGQP